MSNLGITFDGKHSYRDFGLKIVDRIIGNPRKIKKKERIPYSNQVYDFSGLYGGQEYEERQLTYVFNIRDYQKIGLENKKTEIVNWIMRPFQKVKLIDDYFPGYYFMAEAENEPSFNEGRFNGQLTITFTAYPFRISELEEGHDIWDEFNFLLDVAQETTFEVSGTLDTTLYNVGIKKSVYPIIEASSPMEIKKGGIIYQINAGTTQSYDFALSHRENKITITGNGTISFHFRKELI